MVVIWSKRAKVELQNAYSYIAAESLQNAEKFRDELIEASADLGRHPQKHPLDKFKDDNDGSFRAFEKHHYRISYQVTPTEILIARMRHSSRSPEKF